MALLGVWLLVAIPQGTSLEPPRVIAQYASHAGCMDGLRARERSGLHPRAQLACVPRD